MSDKELAKVAWMAAFTSARKGSFTSNELGPVTERTAKNKFERWWEINQSRKTEKVGMGCPTCGAHPDRIASTAGHYICKDCGCILNG